MRSLDNAPSHAVHRALGFGETERVVFFRRCRAMTPRVRMHRACDDP